MPTYDLTTLLSKFLNDLYAGTIGTTIPISVIKVGDGSASAPSYSFANQTNAGLYRISANTIGISANGTNIGYWNGTAFVLNQLSFDASSLDVSLSRGAANRLDLATGDSFRLVSGGLGVGATETTAGNITAAGTITTGAGTTAIAPLVVTNGTNLTAATANAIENDGVAFYGTIDTTNGRRYSDEWNYFRLTGSGTGITTIADFFGANSAIPMVANGIYEIEWHCFFSQATAGTATWTVTTATTALATVTGEYIGSNIAGIQAVGAPQMAGINTTASSATAFPVTGTEATGVTHYFKIRILCSAGNGASNTRLRLTMSAGTATPLINSYYKVRRLSAGNVGAFVA